MMQGSSETIRQARELNPDLLILARSSYLREIPSLRRAGADIVFSGEGEVALSMTEFLLRQLGATEEQIDREEARVREDLFGGTSASPVALQDRAWPTGNSSEVAQVSSGENESR
jgi:CPA2 family monovalent cation:H+ antiporter-2